MLCGVNLGILLICLVQVEYVRCLWEMRGKGFKKQNGNAYDPFTQNRLRQALFSSGFDPSLDPKDSRTYLELPGSDSSSKASSKLTQSHHPEVRYIKTLPPVQMPKDVLQKWSVQWSETTGASSVSEYSSPKNTDLTAVRPSPVEGSQGQRQHMSSDYLLSKLRGNYAFKKRHVNPVNQKGKLKTSMTVRGKPKRGSRNSFNNLKGQVPNDSSHQRYNPQPYGSFSWGQPQSTFNQEESSSTVTYHVADEYGGSSIVRQRRPQ